MLLGLLVAGRAGSPDMAQAAIMGGQAAMLQAQLNFLQVPDLHTTSVHADGKMSAVRGERDWQGVWWKWEQQLASLRVVKTSGSGGAV